jgi:hypothetical protein
LQIKLDYFRTPKIFSNLRNTIHQKAFILFQHKCTKKFRKQKKIQNFAKSLTTLLLLS